MSLTGYTSESLPKYLVPYSCDRRRNRICQLEEDVVSVEEGPVLFAEDVCGYMG